MRDAIILHNLRLLDAASYKRFWRNRTALSKLSWRGRALEILLITGTFKQRAIFAFLRIFKPSAALRVLNDLSETLFEKACKEAEEEKTKLEEGDKIATPEKPEIITPEQPEIIKPKLEIIKP